MIRVVLPTQLKKLAHVDGEVKLYIEGPVTQGSVLDTLEAQYGASSDSITSYVGLAVPLLSPAGVISLCVLLIGTVIAFLGRSSAAEAERRMLR